MSKSKLEYIWLDGYKPTQSLRSKTKVVSDFDGKLSSCPMWSFDGSSTLQAPGGSSDCLLKPVAIYPDPERKNGFLVMTEVLNADGSAHESNGRATIDDSDNDFWFGFEQILSLGYRNKFTFRISKRSNSSGTILLFCWWS
jgi:glutamine synthetase